MNGAAKRLANLRPFVRGRSGNPSGAASLFNIYAAEFGDMTPVERFELRQFVNLMRRAKRADDNDAVRMMREAREWLEGIRARRAVPSLDLDALLAEE